MRRRSGWCWSRNVWPLKRLKSKGKNKINSWLKVGFMERDLALMKQQFQDMVTAVGEDNEEVDGDDNRQSEASKSTTSVTMVSHPTLIYKTFP